MTAGTSAWTFIGNRLLSTGKLVNAWIDPAQPDERLMVDFRIKGMPGALYDVETTADGRYKLGSYVGRVDSPDPEWALDTETHRARHAQIALDKRLARDANGQTGELLDSLTIAEARSRLLACRTSSERAAMTAVLLRRLGVA